MFFEWTTETKKDNPQKKKGWLRQSFDVARTYIMPLSLNIKKKDGEWGVVFNSRKSVYNFVKVGTAHVALNAALWFSFPNAEQYCEKNDIDPSMASALTDTSVRVVPQNFLRTAFYYTQNTIPLVGLATGFNIAEDDKNTYFVRYKPGWFLWESYMASLPGKDFTRTDLIKNVVPPAYLENLPATKEDMRALVTGHELAHTHSARSKGSRLANFDTRVEEETMADINGVWEAAKVTGNEQLPILWAHRRALDIIPYDPHNNALYLDAKLNGTAYPDMKEMIKANQEFYNALKAYLPSLPDDVGPEELFEHFYLSLAVTAKALLEMESLDLSPLAQRRAELVVEAAKFFSPTIFKATDIPAVTIVAPKSTAPDTQVPKEPENDWALGYTGLKPPAPTPSL